MARTPPKLHSEIIIDILSRLPVKPLLRFKCVCKSWRSLISNNPQFAKTHLQYAQRDTNLNRHKLFLFTFPLKSIDLESYCNGDSDIVTRELNFPPTTPDPDVEFVESCNGLISIAFYSESDPQIILFNPSTEESRNLPPNSCQDYDDVFFGFGYDSTHDDYKVVRGSNCASNSEFRMEIFSVKGTKWRTVDQNLHSSMKLEGSATFLNGVLYWLINQKTVIVSFDLAEEKFTEMITVPNYVPQDRGIDLKVLGDYLCVCATTYIQYCEAWRIEGHGRNASWSRFFNFNSDPLPGCRHWLEVIWVAKNGNILFNLDGWELVLYDPKHQTSKQYRVPNDGDWFLATAYIESLISPNGSQG